MQDIINAFVYIADFGLTVPEKKKKNKTKQEKHN